MKTIQLLEETDILCPDDWSRPLELRQSQFSDSYFFTNAYSGTPINNVEWVKASAIFGACWMGRPIKDLNAGTIKYEFVRGNIPKDHCLLRW